MITYWLLYVTIVFYSIVDAVQTKMLFFYGRYGAKSGVKLFY